MSLHTCVPRGKRVLIILHTGAVVIDKFVNRTRNKWVVLETQRIHVRDIRSFAPYRKIEGGR